LDACDNGEFTTLKKPNKKGQAMTNEANVEKLLTDLKTLSRDAEAMLHTTTGQAGEKMGELRERLTAALDSARTTGRRLEEKAADQTIREHPYESMGVAFGIGLLIGMLVGRK